MLAAAACGRDLFPAQVWGGRRGLRDFASSAWGGARADEPTYTYVGCLSGSLGRLDGSLDRRLYEEVACGEVGEVRQVGQAGQVGQVGSRLEWVGWQVGEVDTLDRT